MHRTKLRLDEKLKRFPPVVCRLLARKIIKHNHVVALTDAEIAKSSGLSMADVVHISWSAAWDSIPVSKMLAFTKACGVDFDDRPSLQKNTKLVEGGRFFYLRRSPNWKTQLEPIVREWANSGA